jgi:BirA family biotin operon repressor/biotin-[acetyl-CoA-carboxylase] ligase
MKWIKYQTVDSTNKKAKQFIKNNQIRTFTVITAEQQLDGKGTKCNTWYSDNPNGLYMSCIVPNVQHITQSSETLVTSIATKIKRVLTELTGLDIYVEWPNDLMINQKKCGGILMELTKHNQHYLIIGIGINVNQTHFPNDLKYIATSLYLQSNKHYDKDIVTQHISKQIQQMFI